MLYRELAATHVADLDRVARSDRLSRAGSHRGPRMHRLREGTGRLLIQVGRRLVADG